MARTPDPRTSYGVAGGGLIDAAWAANAEVARIGRKAEIRTAQLLEDRRPDRTAVLHDVAIPAAGYTANIDHVIVSGRTVVLIDTKAWKPGRYWTSLGAHRRGWHRFEHAGSGTPAMARDRIARYLADRGLRAAVAAPLVAVWPSSASGRVNVRWLRMDRCRVLPAERLPGRLARIAGNRPPDPQVLAALRGLVGRTGSPAPRRRARR